MKDTIIGYPLLEFDDSLIGLLAGKPEGWDAGMIAGEEAWKPGRQEA